MKITPPTEPDIALVLQELDIHDNSVTKDKFSELITLVISKMLESEIELENSKKGMS